MHRKPIVALTPSVPILAVLAVLAVATAAGARPADPNAGNDVLAAEVDRAMRAGDANAALAASRRLHASDSREKAWEDNLPRLARLMARTGRPDEALAFLQDRAAGVADDGHARHGLARVAGRLAREEEDPNRRVAFYKAAADLFPEHPYVFRRYVDALVETERIDEALTACGDRATSSLASARDMRRMRLRILTGTDRAAQTRAEAVAFLKVATSPEEALEALPLALPPGDVALCAAQNAQAVFNGVKLSVRRKTGRLQRQALVALAEQLTQGGDARPLTVSDRAGDLAEELTAAKAPLAGYLSNLLSGDYPAAWRAAFAAAREAESDGLYIAWIEAAAGAIRCHDQHYNGRALQFVRYVNGETAENPLAE